MRLVVQRVSEARVIVDLNITGSIGLGLLVLIGIAKTDSADDADYLVEKLLTLRIFPDIESRMNLNVEQAGGALLLVSQFTLLASCKRGRRPSFDDAAPPEQARNLYDYFVSAARRGPVPVETGVFQASMQVQLVNQGPVTILLDSIDRKQK